ncbi:RNA polymerase sigma factor [uncultured Bacteroides sp.]|uniref:RNA polymerase sigma factor n=1 Tax=uncultured Bacteroides sp. TaxID=162156 RepID=UPI0025F232D2|nr:sigma-70 family RNA polymerase sigma factor [uncultured Bacteroides sp.]
MKTLKEGNKKQDEETLSDEVLWKMMSCKDESALSILYRKHFDSLYNYGIHLCSNEELVKDCIQNLFLALYNLRKYAPVRNVTSYLLMSLRNNIIAALHDEERNTGVEELNFELSISEEELFHLFGHDDGEMNRIHKLRQSYDKLNSNQRHAIYLRFIKEMNWQEMEEIMGISTHSCMNLVGRAIVKLRRLMKDT